MKKMLENKLAAMTGDQFSSPTAKRALSQPDAAITLAKQSSPKDIVLWVLAIAALIAATLTNAYLPQYWQPASSVWTRIAVIVGLVVFAVLCLALTQQGRAFKTLLADSRIELRRVTWPSKAEVTHYTWQVIVMTGLLALLVWLMDMAFSAVIHWIIG